MSEITKLTLVELTKKIKAPLVYLNMIGGQDDLVFDGESFILNEENKLILRLNPFRTQVKTLDLNKINPTEYYLIKIPLGGAIIHKL